MHQQGAVARLSLAFPWLALLCLAPLSCAGTVTVAQGPIAVAAQESVPDVVATPPQAADEGCVSRVIAGHLYFLCREPLAFDQARTRCRALGADLASLGTAYENDAVALLASGAGVGSVLVGLSDAASEGSFENLDGSPSSTAAWLPGEPNDLGGEDCLELTPQGGWNDVSCATTQRPFVCEQASPCTVEVIGEHLYHFCRRPGDWTAAREYCLQLGSDLVVPSTAEENAAIAGRIGVSIGVPWVGLTDASVEGTFVGVDGSPLAVSAWYPGEPNDAGSGEDCAQLYADGQWNDLACAGSDLDSFVCEAPTPCVQRELRGHRYVFCLQPANTIQAREACRQLGGELAIVESAEEDQFLYLTMAIFHRARFYIGLSDEQQEGDFRWWTGAPLTYAHWNAGEPNDQNGEDCAEIIEGGVWNDISCTDYARNAFVCELR